MGEFDISACVELQWTNFHIFLNFVPSYSVIDILLHSNGANETGLYIATTYLFEMANAEQEVDIFHSLKHIRIPRPQFITSMVRLSIHNRPDLCIPYSLE